MVTLDVQCETLGKYCSERVHRKVFYLCCERQICHVVVILLLTLSPSVFFGVFVPGRAVQEDERNSSEDPTNPHSDLLRRTQTGTSFTSGAPVGQDVVRGTDGGRGRLFEGLEGSPGPRSASSPSSPDQGPLRPTSTLQGLTVAGRADRETLPLPEEEPNNGADTSGAAHLGDGKISTRERARPYFQPTDSLFHTANTANTEKESDNEGPQTRIAATHATAISSNSSFGTSTATQTSKLSTNTQTRSSARVPPLKSSSPSGTNWESDTVPIPRVGAVSEASRGERPHSRRSQRSTDGLNSDLSSAVTSDPLGSPTEPQQGDSHTRIEPTAPSPSSSQASSGTQSSAARIAEPGTTVGAAEAASFRPNASGADSSESTGSEVTGQTAAFEFSDELEIRHTFTSSTPSHTNASRSTEGGESSPPPDTPSTFTRAGEDETHAANATSSSRGLAEVHNGTLSFTDSSSSSAPLTSGDVVQTSATTTTGTHTPRPTRTLLNNSSPTNSSTPVPPLSASTAARSSTPSHTLQTHTASPSRSRLTRPPLSFPSSTTESAAHTPPLIGHEPTAAPSQTSQATSSRTPGTQNQPPLTPPTNVPVTLTQPGNDITTEPTPPLSLTTAISDDGRGGGEGEDGEREDESRQRLPSGTTTRTRTAGAPSWTTSHPSQETSFTPSVLSSTTSQTPTFYIMPDQPSVIRGNVHICV